MKKIIVSGLVNTETNVRVEQFPIEYYPIDYTFFGVSTGVSGVAYNVTKALTVLGDHVQLMTLLGNDFGAEYAVKRLDELKISTKHVQKKLRETPNTVVLYDKNGKRQIYCDLKDIQDVGYDFGNIDYENCDAVIACNTNFNRTLLRQARMADKIIATDVHVLTDTEDVYNADFMRYSNLLFLSDENIQGYEIQFISDIAKRYENDIIVLGRGSKGAMMYVKEEKQFYEVPAVKNERVVNTVGAGDALFSAFVHFYIAGNTPIDALKKAEIFASVKIGFNGASNGFAEEAEINAEFIKIQS